jgi:hypothetical protein
MAKQKKYNDIIDRMDQNCTEVHYCSPNKKVHKSSLNVSHLVIGYPIARAVAECLYAITGILKHDMQIPVSKAKVNNKKITERCDNDIIMRKFREAFLYLVRSKLLPPGVQVKDFEDDAKLDELLIAKDNIKDSPISIQQELRRIITELETLLKNIDSETKQ